MRVGIVSTFRVTCGVGIYCEQLSEELSKLCDLKIFAENLIPPQVENAPLGQSPINYERCWLRGGNYESLQQKILEYKPDIVHVQFVSGLFSSLDYNPDSAFQKFISNLRVAGIKPVLTFHDIPEYPHYQGGNPQMQKWYEKLQAKFIVLNINMSACLREWYQQADITLIPLGTPFCKTYDKMEAREKLKLNKDDFILMQLGFYGVDKGMLEIIEALPNMKIPNLKLVFAGGFHPLTVDVHRQHVKECIVKALKLGVAKQIVFVNKLLTEDEMDLWGSASDMLILNHKLVFSHGGSASAHRILQFKKPIVMSDSPKLSEFIDKVQCVKTPSNRIAETVNGLYADKVLQEKISQGAYEHALKTSFKAVAEKHLEVYNK
jgi:hypothetical protein